MLLVVAGVRVEPVAQIILKIMSSTLDQSVEGPPLYNCLSGLGPCPSRTLASTAPEDSSSSSFIRTQVITFVCLYQVRLFPHSRLVGV